MIGSGFAGPTLLCFAFAVKTCEPVFDIVHGLFVSELPAFLIFGVGVCLAFHEFELLFAFDACHQI